MRSNHTIYAIGETIFDIIIGQDESISGGAGGSVLNAAVSLSRLGLNCELLSEIGTDAVGEKIRDFLLQNKVSTSYSYFFNSGKTAIALAFLNEKFDAKYTFYKQFPKKRFQVKIPNFHSGDFLIFGSSFALTHEVRIPLLKILQKAREKDVVILYDPNFRTSEKVSINEQLIMFKENIALADIVRGSAEDFSSLLHTLNSKDTFEEIRKYSNAVLIYSNGALPGILKDDRLKVGFNPHVATVQSTVGAGDNFNAGIIAGLAKLNYNRQELHSIKTDAWEIIIDIGLTLAALVCASTENYISDELARKLTVSQSK